jgi:hypothetical protein
MSFSCASLQLAAAAAAAAAATAGLAVAGAKASSATNGNVCGMKASVQTLLNDCYALGACRHGELDDRVLQALASLREADGIQALGEFMRADMSKIRNKSAYFSGVVSRFKEDGNGGRLSIKPASGVTASFLPGAFPVVAAGVGPSPFAGGAQLSSHHQFGAAGPASFTAASAAVASVNAQQLNQQHQQMLIAQAAAQQQVASNTTRVQPALLLCDCYELCPLICLTNYHPGALACSQHQHQLMLIGAGAVSAIGAGAVGAGGLLGGGHLNAAAGIHMAAVPGLGGELCSCSDMPVRNAWP